MSDSLPTTNCSTADFPPSLSPRVCSNSCPLSWRCRWNISSSVTPSPVLSLSQRHDLSQWVDSSHQAVQVLELQHQSFQWEAAKGIPEGWRVQSLLFNLIFFFAPLPASKQYGYRSSVMILVSRQVPKTQGGSPSYAHKSVMQENFFSLCLLLLHCPVCRWRYWKSVAEQGK